MPQIITYRDTPKRGETDAKWCGYIAEDNGHIIRPGTIGHETEREAYEALAAGLVQPPTPANAGER